MLYMYEKSSITQNFFEIYIYIYHNKELKIFELGCKFPGENTRNIETEIYTGHIIFLDGSIV